MTAPATEYQCTHGHDRCSYPSEDCPYCEVKTFGTLYRYDDVQYSAGTDERGDPLPCAGEVRVHLTEYGIVKRTEQGAWIEGFERPKFVNLTRRKRFACATKQEAMESFLARKSRQRAILSSQLNRVDKAVQAAKKVSP